MRRLRERTSDEFNWIMADYFNLVLYPRITDKEITIDNTAFGEDEKGETIFTVSFLERENKQDYDYFATVEDFKKFVKKNLKALDCVLMSSGSGWKIKSLKEVMSFGLGYAATFYVEYDKEYDFATPSNSEKLSMKTH